ncbi:hypothetical protein NFI96_004765 [Prochilodus magdalenae]|nr:hypothetical protein NFI96_004765 [Prochilodus magdalenae]
MSVVRAYFIDCHQQRAMVNSQHWGGGSSRAVLEARRARGIIRTALPNMDRETRDQYVLVIQAKDMMGQLGGLSGTTSVTVTLTDVNDNPPRFSRKLYEYDVLESVPVASVVARLKAVDADIGSNAEMDYRIVDGDGLGMFNITTDEQTQEGIIILQRSQPSLEVHTKRRQVRRRWRFGLLPTLYLRKTVLAAVQFATD